MIKPSLALALALATMWISSTVVLAAEPFTVKLKFDEKGRGTLNWPAVAGATQYCIRSTDLVSLAEQCVPDHSIDYPLQTHFGNDITAKSQFTVTAKDKDGKPIADASADSQVKLNDVVIAKTEFGEFSNLGSYAGKIMQYALPLGIALAVIMTLYAGIQFMLSQGQPDKIKDAQEILQGAVLGLMVLIMARFLVNFLFVPTTDLTSTQSAAGPVSALEQP